MTADRIKARSEDKLFYKFVYEILEVAGVPIEFFKYMEKRYRVIVFGGSVRDYLIYGQKSKIRDVDLVISGLEDVFLLNKLLGKYFDANEWSCNQFGGVKIRTNGLTLDCWRLEDTYAFRKDKVKIGVVQLLDTPMLNIDRYAYDMSTRSYVAGCNKKVFPAEVDFNLYVNELLELNLVRALVYSKKYNLELSCKWRQVFTFG